MFRTSTLKLALIIAFSLGTAAARGADWSTTAIPWSSGDLGVPIGKLPQTVVIPPQAYAYAAQSQRVDIFRQTEPTILRVTLRVRSGSAGIALADADGAGLTSKEVILTPTGADATVYFRIWRGMPSSIIVLRNYNAPGRSGEVVLRAVQFVHEGDLTNQELADLFQSGLN